MIFAIHGFLGSSSDWNELKKRVSFDDWCAPSLFETFKWPASISFESVVRKLREDYYLPHINSYPTSSKKFVGYSLGGRLGLTWLELFPNDFDQWFFISTHPGLTSPSEKQTRLKADEDWALKLRDLDQQSFLNQWRAQPVFSGTSQSTAIELSWNKTILIDALLNLSLANQKDFSDVLKNHQEKTRWIVGQNDQKFLDIALKLKKDVKIQHLHILLGGHRVHLDQPKPLGALISR